VSQGSVAAKHGARDNVLAGWQRQSWPQRILRFLLGATFLYAGLQKFADPGFLHSGTPDYIGSQLQAFARGSPIRPLLLLAGHAPVLTGLIVALLETAIGIGILLGVAPIAWALIGLAINLALFLSATWHVHPYFLGSDSIYAVAWAAYLAGLLQNRKEATRAALVAQKRGSRRQRADAAKGIGRREFLRAGLVAAGAALLGAVAFGAEGHETVAADPAKALTRSPSPTSTSPSVQGTPITSLDKVPIGGSVDFTDPAQGPSVLVRLSRNRVQAYSRVCTHAGCLVDYDSQARLLVCPCHGAEFDPAHGAQPIAGPAPSPLTQIPVAIDRSGTVVATS